MTAEVDLWPTHKPHTHIHIRTRARAHTLREGGEKEWEMS